MRERLAGGRVDRPLLLCVGRLAAEKNLHSLAPVLAEIPGAQLAFVGDGPERARLRRILLSERDTGDPNAPGTGKGGFIVRTAAAGANEDDLRADIRFLADDLLEGRGPGARGGELAQLYIAARMEAIGLEPAGANGSYLQPFEVVGVRSRPAGLANASSSCRCACLTTLASQTSTRLLSRRR